MVWEMCGNGALKLAVSYFGAANGEGAAVQTKMPPNMQYAYMSLWCLMASPLFYSGDMSKLDAFTLNVLCNNEVIAVDQDPLGECAKAIVHNDSTFIMVKNMADGTKAIGLFNRNNEQKEMAVNWNELHLSGKQQLRDLWRQKDIGIFSSSFTTAVPAKGVIMLKLKKI
jgi:alpha-galactosidase